MRYQCLTFIGFVLCGAMSALAVTFQAHAQEPVSEQHDSTLTDEIIVERERLVDIRAASELARDLSGHPNAREPLARLAKPLCLQMSIDDSAFGLTVGRRIIANARAANVSIAKPGCRPNALVIMADDMREKIERFRKKGRFFGRLKRHEIDRALDVRDPVYVFQNEERSVSIARGRLDRVVRKDTVSSAVMIENRASAGLSAEQVADYATMRLFAPTRELDVVAEGAPKTIMTLYSSPDGSPPGLTRFDRAFLEALYRLRYDATATEVLQEAARSLSVELER